MNMLGEYILAKALDRSFAAAKDVTKRILSAKQSKLRTTRMEIEESLTLHLRSIKNWSDEVSFSGIKKAKSTIDIFVELDLYVYPRRLRIEENEQIQSIPLREIFEQSDRRHFVILGQPGAGKTTSMKRLCQLLLYDEEFQRERFAFPILIKFRDLNNVEIESDSSLLVDELFRILGLRVELSEEFMLDRSERKSVREKIAITFLEELKVLLILDGFDELVKDKSRDLAISEIGTLATQLEQCTMVITSRSGDFRFRPNNTDEYEICPLNKEQVSTFVSKWLNDKKEASHFLAKIYKSPFADAAIRPLTLAHLCAIYERIKDIPQKPKTVYKKIVNLLLEEWDQERSVKRESKYANFEVDRKYEFLCQLAYVLTEGLRATVFSTRDLLFVYKQIHAEYGLKAGEARQVVSEIESHNGLFLQSGYEQFEFAHKSLQEFLTAEYVVKLPSIPQDPETLEVLPNELAIAVAISSNAAIYFIELILIRLKEYRLSADFVRTLMSRLLIEKPDFKTTELLELALLGLYTYYIETTVLRADRLKSLDSDPIFKDFERLIKSHHTQDVLGILKCYETKNIYETLDKDKIHRLVLNRTLVPTHLQRVSIKFPETLCVRSSLLYSRLKRKPST
jgi:hypothetical protein